LQQQGRAVMYVAVDRQFAGLKKDGMLKPLILFEESVLTPPGSPKGDC
jgi:hypothetical protein